MMLNTIYNFGPSLSWPQRALLWLQRKIACLRTRLLLEENQLLCWAPITLALGIALYFAWPYEPAWWPDQVSAVAGGVLAITLLAGRTLWLRYCCDAPARDWPLTRWCSWSVFWIAIGFLQAYQRTHRIDPGMLAYQTAPVWITGTIMDVDHLASRYHLFQRVVLRCDQPGSLMKHSWPQLLPPDPRHPAPKRLQPLPTHVMITVRTRQTVLYPGERIRIKAILSAFAPPCAPVAYDACLNHFYRGIGARGYALTSPRRIDPFDNHFSSAPAAQSPHTSQQSAPPPSWLSAILLALARLRHRISAYLYNHLTPPLGAVACGFITGDKAALTPGVRQWFADSGLAHLLAIAGLHVSILAGLCLGLFRWLFSRRFLSPYQSWSQTASSLLSLGVCGAYVLLSGARYPALRAFFMLTFAIVASLCARRRHAMRTLMLCAGGFLLWAPESLLMASYQLSFGAVAGLLALYQARNPFRPLPYPRLWRLPADHYHRRLVRFLTRSWVGRWLYWHARTKLTRTVRSSLYASAAITGMTFPIMMHHFSHVSLQGFLANMIAIPYTALVIMPLGMICLVVFLLVPSFVFLPLLKLWEWSLQGLVIIAQKCAHHLDLLVMPTVPPSLGWLSVAMLGLMWMALWQTSWRWWGGPLAIAATLMSTWTTARPIFFLDTQHRVWAACDPSRQMMWVSSFRRGKQSVHTWHALWPQMTCQLAPSKEGQVSALSDLSIIKPDSDWHTIHINGKTYNLSPGHFLFVYPCGAVTHTAPRRLWHPGYVPPAQSPTVPSRMPM